MIDVFFLRRHSNIDGSQGGESEKLESLGY